MAPQSFRPGPDERLRRPSLPADATTLDHWLLRILTPFVGRAHELAEIVSLLEQGGARLLTLTGPAGVGKTRLALAVAERIADAFEDGVVFVPLSPVSDPTQLGSTIAAVLGVREAEGRSLDAQLVAWLEPRQVLLVLDNFEQIIDAAPFVSELLTDCPRLTIIVTSRWVLRLTGEQMYEVPPLPLPENEPGKPIEDAEAVRLFVVRAQAARPSFELTDENARAIADICREVDGLPLAIELAAARIRHLSPVDLLARLSRRLALLNDGPLDAPARLRTMRDAIAWSHDLLSPDEQIVFRRMAVFAGGFTLGAAESVLRALASDGDGQVFLTTPAVFNALASLVDKSLLRPEMAPDGETRFTMLETIREFALEELAASGEETAARTALVGFVLELARQSRAALYLPEGGQLTEHLTNDRDNIRAAIRWLFEQEDRAGSLQLLGVPTSIWRSIGNLSEARPWLEWIIAGGDELNGVDRATALVELGILRHLQGDEADALRLTEEGIALLKEHGAEQRLFPALSYLGLIVLRLGDFERASALQQESLRILETTVDEPWAPFAVSTVLGHLGNIAVAEGRIDRARDYFTAAIDRQREVGFQPGESHIFASHPIAGMGDVERAEGHLEQALEQYQLSLRQARRFTDRRAICYALGGVAGTLAAMGNWETAARLFGATEALHEVSGIPFDLETMDRQRALGLPEPWYRGDESFGVAQQFHDLLGAPNTRLASVPDPARAARLWQDGRHLSLTQAVDEALDAAIVPPGADAPVDAHGLTVREVEVLRLITEGHSDPDIAQALFISRRTAATHVANILRKLGVNSRAAAAAFAVRNGLA